MKAALAAALLFAAAAPPALAKPAAIEVVQPWSRPAVAGSTGAGYLTLVNRGKADALVGVASPLAEKVEMHASSMTGGVMRMTPETRVALPANGSVSFAPGGRHLMFVGLKKPLKLGDKLPATLSFASGLKLKAEFVVGTGASAQPMGQMDHMEHMDHMH